MLGDFRGFGAGEIAKTLPHGDEDGASFKGTVLTLEQRNVKTEIFIRSKGTWKHERTNRIKEEENENITNL